MRWKQPAWWVFLSWALVAAACELSDTDVRETPVERITIVDLDGKHWDITQAVARYGFDPARFAYGLGAFAVVPLMTPPVAAPSDSGYPASDDAFSVIGGTFAGEARAYRLDDLVGVELVDDVVGGEPIAVVHRPLLGAPSIHARVVAGTVLTLSASGWVYEDQSVIFDYETESLWYRLAGERRLTCIAGRLFQATLAERPSVVQAWEQWRGAHPATGFMLRPALTNERSSTRAGTTTPNPTGSRSPA
jgi:Protein of unknown function (DUF3179)